MKRAPRDPNLARRWQAFVRNHRDAMAAMDFFTVPTVTFQLLYCFFIISHERRQILHVNVTRHPTSTWTAQQLREAFPLRIRSQIPALRSRQKIWSGSTRCPSLPANHGRANLNPKSLAKRCCGTLGRQLPARSALVGVSSRKGRPRCLRTRRPLCGAETGECVHSSLSGRKANANGH